MIKNQVSCFFETQCTFSRLFQAQKCVCGYRLGSFQHSHMPHTWRGGAWLAALSPRTPPPLWTFGLDGPLSVPPNSISGYAYDLAYSHIMAHDAKPHLAGKTLKLALSQRWSPTTRDWVSFVDCDTKQLQSVMAFYLLEANSVLLRSSYYCGTDFWVKNHSIHVTLCCSD